MSEPLSVFDYIEELATYERVPTFTERMQEARAASDRSLAYIRQNYGVPAYRGRRVFYRGKPARISGGDGQYLRLRFDGDKKPHPAVFHPTSEVTYGNCE